ncbi:MAG: hypothetical protein WEB37_13195 [Bacteroidota bacterium]
MQTNGHCADCQGEVTRDSDFCPHCGKLFGQAGAAFCDVHPAEAAGGICIICRRLLCRQCSYRKSGRLFCIDHKSVTVEQDWVLIFESPDINEAELIKSFLQSVGVHVVVRNFGPNTVVWEGGGDSLFSRQALNRLAKLFVPIPEYEQSRQALEEWDSAKGMPSA